MVLNYQLEQAARLMIISKLGTGNMIFDSLLSVILLCLLPKILPIITILKDKVITLFNEFNDTDKYKLTLEGKITLNKYGLVTYTFSNNIRGILFYINKNINKLKIYNLQEIVTNDNSRLKENGDRDRFIETNYIINQNKKFCISNDINCKIEISKNMDISESKDKIILDKMILSVTLSSNKKLQLITEFVSNVHQEYVRYTADNILSNQYYFGIKNIDSDNNKIIYDQYNFNSNITFNNIFFEGKKELVSSINFFLNNQDYYSEKGLPHRLGLLLHGEPGCGKTSIIKAIANYTKRHIVNINFRSIKSKNDLENIFFSDVINDYNIKNNKKIYVIEEFDVNAMDILNDRKINDEEKSEDELLKNCLKTLQLKKESEAEGYFLSKEKKNTLTLGSVLEILDGIIENSNRLIIITTNDFNKLDKALLRPGRIDKILQFKKCNHKIMCDIIYHFFKNSIDKQNIDNLKKLINKNVVNTKEYVVSPAELVNLCCKFKDNINELFHNIQHVSLKHNIKN